jgi:choline dehydrogenase
MTESNLFSNILVGAGATGCVLANKLSESYNVLLLEAGGDNHHPMIKVPVVFFNNQNRFPHDWQYRTVPQQNSSFAANGNVFIKILKSF